jgi:hypothetical protein
MELKLVSFLNKLMCHNLFSKVVDINVVGCSGIWMFFFYISKTKYETGSNFTTHMPFFLGYWDKELSILFNFQRPWGL